VQKKSASRKQPAEKSEILEQVVALSDGFYLAKGAHAKSPRRSVRAVSAKESASVLVREVGKALKKPGIGRGVVFPKGISGKLYSYSVDPNEPSRILRKTRTGKSSVGTFADGRFRSR
jgi:hypothetical protein